MTFNDEQTKALSAPLNSATVKQRQQGGTQVSYIEGWHAIAEANRIFGFGNWNRETVDIVCVSERQRKIGEGKTWEKDGFGVTYTAKVRVTVGDVVREGVGAGHGIDVDPGQAHESAIKEAETDAMKRALMTFGNPFGLALYDKTQSNVASAPKAEPKAANLPTVPVKNGADGPDWEGFVTQFIGYVASAPDNTWINAFVKQHKAALDNLKTADPTFYASVQKATQDRRTDIENQQERAA
jgi:DNA repair and recombination protein RAD52